MKSADGNNSVQGCTRQKTIPGHVRRCGWCGCTEKGGCEWWTVATDEGCDTRGYNGVLLDSPANDAWCGKLCDAVGRTQSEKMRWHGYSRTTAKGIFWTKIIGPLARTAEVNWRVQINTMQPMMPLAAMGTATCRSMQMCNLLQLGVRCVEQFQEVTGYITKNFWELCWKITKRFWKISRIIAENFDKYFIKSWKIFRKILRIASQNFQNHFKKFKVKFQSFGEILQIFSRSISENFKKYFGYFRKVFRKIPKNTLEIFDKIFRKISRIISENYER